MAVFGILGALWGLFLMIAAFGQIITENSDLNAFYAVCGVGCFILGGTLATANILDGYYP